MVGGQKRPLGGRSLRDRARDRGEEAGAKREKRGVDR